MRKTITLLSLLLLLLTYVAHSQTCGGLWTITLCTANLDDGSLNNNYSNNLNCSYLIQPPGATSILMNFTAFDIESGYDFLEIHDGSSAAAPLIGIYTGTSLPPNVVTTGGSLFMLFTSDNSYNYAGWSSSYYCLGGGGSFCNGLTNITNCSGTISDGSGTSNYSDNSNCQWSINPSGTNLPKLHFTQFDTEAINDQLTVYDSPDNSGNVLGNWSGNTIPSDVTSTTGALYVLFTTDGSTTAGGFSATYSCVAPQCTGTTNITTCSGTLSDGSGNSDYQNNLDCGWLIQPAGANNITLHFTAFDTEVLFDYLEVFDGPSASANSLGLFSGNSIPADIVSSGGSLYLKFTTDVSAGAAGWSINYTCNNGVGIPDIDELINYSLYPNPNDGTFKMIIEFNSPSLVYLSMKDAMGRTVKTWAPQVIGNKHSQKMEVSDLAKGVYTLVAETNGRSYHRSVAIIK